MRYFVLAFVCYLVGTAAIVCLFWFMKFGWLDNAVASFSVGAAVSNLIVFLIFPLQHSLLARTWWKNWVTQRMHPLMERPLYVGTSGIALGLVMWLWKPVGPVVFRFENRLPFDIAFAISIALILWTAKTIDQSSLFGLKHGIAAWKGATMPDHGLTRKGPFGLIRHPLTSFLIVAIWSHHVLTASRLEWNLLLTLYSLVGVIFEERDLKKKLGEQYAEYSRTVPAFIPSLRSLTGTRR